MFVNHLCVLGEMSVWVFCPLFDWAVCFSGTELYELLVYFGIEGRLKLQWERSSEI